ncbi:MAG: hypothetical protein ACLR17_00385 [Enterobacteriaceae bacterium]
MSCWPLSCGRPTSLAAPTRNKLLTETATGYDQVIQEVKATAIQTHKLLAEVKVREQQRNAKGAPT